MDISVILPIHKIDDTNKPLFENAIKSVETQQFKPAELLIVAADDKELLKYIKSIDFGELKDITRIIENDGDTSFSAQMNKGVSEATSEWISFIEMDDEYSSIWFKNAKIYAEAYEDVDVFLPIIVDTDTEGRFIGFTNEAVWAAEFSDELGHLDNNSLLTYQNFNFDGMIIKKETYEEFGGLKESMKLTFIYEFLLRLTYNDARIMTIPKLGYKHTNQREGSLFHDYASSMSQDESRWWMSMAKKESFFNHDRKLTYEQES